MIREVSNQDPGLLSQGTYSFLSRLLYYCTLIFSLFSRAHLWLVAGALASALVYSGSAAVHACLLVWKGPNPYIENDSWALYAILNAACLITVPLLNWSGTLRRLGQRAASLKDPKGLKTNADVGTRSIVIYWAFLVLVGFICIWQQTTYGEADYNDEYPDMGKVMCLPGTNASMLMSPNGTYHRRAIDTSFIQDHGCTDPCDLIDIPSIFRNQNDLVLLTHSQELLWNFTIPGPKYERQERIMAIENVNFDIDYYTLPFVLVQGFITALFGRRDPREIRDLIYIKLFMERPISHKPGMVRIQDGFVRVFAGLNYLIACAVVVFCAPFFVISMVSMEFQLWHNQPDAEKPYAVGQWSGWVYTCLVIIAALIARYHDCVVYFIAESCRACGRGLRSCFSRRDKHHERQPEHSFAEMHEKHSVSSAHGSKSDHHQPSVEEMHSTPFTPPHPTHKKTLLQSLAYIYRNACDPINQTGNGPVDEMRNFIRWCRDPQAVSRMVIRHPIRERETRFIDVPPAVVDAEKGDPRAKEQGSNFWRGASVEYQRGGNGVAGG
ncbi:hypothetical protein MMC21_000649 [Puttea exsequens]|nr:hypothetical protein [Puttea exsequens]